MSLRFLYATISCLDLALRQSREDVVGLQGVGWIIGAEDLLLLALPLGLVDGIDVVLDFHNNASVLLYHRRAAVNTLGRLDGQRT